MFSFIILNIVIVISHIGKRHVSNYRLRYIALVLLGELSMEAHELARQLQMCSISFNLLVGISKKKKHGLLIKLSNVISNNLEMNFVHIYTKDEIKKRTLFVLSRTRCI
jgi:hypothetical protein